MTGDEGDGIPERPELGRPATDSGRIGTDAGNHDSGRHVTNRNIVPRTSVGADPRGEPDEFDVVTPISPRLGRADSDPFPQLDTRRVPRWVALNPSAWANRLAGPAPLDRALRIAAILVVLGLGVAGLAQPTSVLRGGLAWLGFLLFVSAGWGTIVARIARADDPDLGLRAALGTAGYLAIAGVLITAGVLTRPAILVLIGLGFAGFAWRELTAPIALWHRVRDGLGSVRRSPALTAFIAVLGAFAVVRIVGAVAALDRSPWDDDVAYLSFVRRLLDTGNLIEPFSFRRLGAYGGQTALDALAGARGTLANASLIDKGLGFAVTLLLLVGYARERRTQPLWLGLVALVVLLFPDTAINTASHWTAAFAFFALYRCVVREQWALAGLAAAMLCTLRMNLIATVCVFLACVLLSRLVALARTMPLREAWYDERRTWLAVTGVAGAVIVPWWIAAFVSSRTFLFPLLGGTWNAELSLRTDLTWPQQLASLVSACVDTQPLVVIPILAGVLPFLSDRRLGRPLISLIWACVIGFVVLAIGFVIADPSHLWRYAFGFATTLAIVLVLELGAEDDAPAGLAPLGRWIVLAALVLQIVVGRGALPKQMVALLHDVRGAAAVDRRGDPTARTEQRRYRAMQSALPAGEPMVVMVDDPAMLDYRRNTIANLDVPGFASPGRGLPAFRGAEALREYLLEQGYRYAAFVRSERSRYCFRRGFWLWRLFNDAEFFEVMSAYAIDAIDNFAELATTTLVLYDTDGLVVLDLASPLRVATRRPAPGDEPSRRGAWVAELADREGLRDAWSLTTRAEVRFEDGFGSLRFVDGAIDDPSWFDAIRPREPAKRGDAILPMFRRAHMRVRGDGDRRLILRGAIALASVYTRPRLDVSLDGELLASAVADDSGRYAIDVVVPAERLSGGWQDLYLVFSTIAEPDKDVRDLRIARLTAFEWTPR